MAKSKQKLLEAKANIISQYESYAITQIEAVYALVELVGQTTRSEVHSILSQSTKRETPSSSVGRALSTMAKNDLLEMVDEKTKGNYDLPNHYFKIK